MIHSHCSSATALARHIGLPTAVEEALAYTFERFDGGGLPLGRSGTELPLAMRVAQLADVAEVHQRSFGLEGAVAMARRRRGGQFDPEVVDALLADPAAVFADPPGGDVWAAALAEAPDSEVRLDPAGLDRLVCAIGDFADLKCPFGVGHSRGVAERAAEAAEVLGLPAVDLRTLCRAGHLHDVGRLGVSNQIWSKPGELTVSDWERVRMHPYLTDRVLSRIPGLSGERMLARSHHEHLDGSGYPLGLAGMALGPGERILTAAVAYQSALEPRPYRAALAPDKAAARLRRRAAPGQLDPTCVDALLSTTGSDTPTVRRDDTLTPREREVLGHVARGLSNRQIAAALMLSEKTVRNHVERTYTKIGATNRVGASLYALEHGLVPVVPASAEQ